MIESVFCASCNEEVWRGEFEAVPDEIVGADERRKPCPNCGSTSRAHRRTVSDRLSVTDSVAVKVTRGITSDRLAVLGLLVGTSLSVWALAGPLWAILSVVALVAALRLQSSRHALMDGMHRITGQ